MNNRSRSNKLDSIEIIRKHNIPIGIAQEIGHIFYADKIPKNNQPRHKININVSKVKFNYRCLMKRL